MAESLSSYSCQDIGATWCPLGFQAIRHNLHLALVVGILRASLVELMHRTFLPCNRFVLTMPILSCLGGGANRVPVQVMC